MPSGRFKNKSKIKIEKKKCFINIKMADMTTEKVIDKFPIWINTGGNVISLLIKERQSRTGREITFKGKSWLGGEKSALLMCMEMVIKYAKKYNPHIHILKFSKAV